MHLFHAKQNKDVYRKGGYNYKQTQKEQGQCFYNIFLKVFLITKFAMA